MKILLLTDMPPCHNFTAGLVLDRLIRFLPIEQIAICSIVHPHLKPIIPKELEIIPHLKLIKPREMAPRRLWGKAGRLLALVFELIQAMRVKYSILPQIVNFAKQQQVDALWVVLEGQTIVRLARPLSCKLALPLFTQVWDSFEWWLRENNIDVYTRRRLLAEFDEVIKHSKSCASASWAMSKTYSHKYGVRSIPVIASLPNKFAKIPATRPHENRNEFIIAIAGQLYAQDAWQCLINTLNQVNWSIAGRRIRLRVLGAHFQVYTQTPTNFEYLGWQSQEETINFLEDSDLLYMPYWFSEEYRLEATNSFPGKLVSYFAAGRPVFCHAPYYASPTRYIAKHNAGILCTSMDSLVVLQKLEHAILNITSYAIVTKNATACFLMDFTLEHMQKTFFEFLGLDSASKNNLKNKFSEVYDKNIFGGSVSRSGEGSDLLQTEIVRNEIPKIIREFKIKTFLDAPCGDWYWMQKTELEVEQYIGVDIVDALIEKNKEEFGNTTRIFKVLNLTKDTLPITDLIFSRDLLVHLNFEDAFKVIANFKKSGATYLLTTTFVNRGLNEELKETFWRVLNLQQPPFNFPKPILLVNEGCTEDGGLYSDKSLGLWLLKDISLSFRQVM